MDWIFVGDAHFALGDGNRRERFIRFIQINRSTLSTLVIMGDLFDFWFGFRDLSPLKREYGDILHLLEGLRAEGIEVIYLEGNHDFRLGPYMSKELGIQVYDRYADIDLDGTRVYLAHGDRAYPKLTHKIFSSLLKNGFTYQLISWLGPQTVISIAKWLSTRSREQGLKESPEIISRLRRFAIHKLDEGFDAVVLAHSHVPEAMAVEREKGVGYYFNVGNWVGDFSYLRYKGERGFSLEYFLAD
ncbi:MAG: UDP-2,3-diacylglucosamine diphosphatase [Deltaproteobacteria bacterium]|nr:UDP-2,3-diacylglucosamine diphosphatase [Deltaproteobacteria bacterium]